MSTPTTWTSDIEDGSVLKNHALSGQLLHGAARKFQFVPFTRKVEGFGAGKGDTVTITQIKALAEPASAKLSEHRRIPVDRLQVGKVSIKVAEWGRGVEYTNLYQQLSHYDPDSEIQMALEDQMAACMDAAAAEAFKSTMVVCTPTGATALSWSTTGAPGATAQVNVGLEHVEQIRDYAVKTLHMPAYDSNWYIGLLTTKALRGVKTGLRPWHQYLQKGDLLYRSEAGEAENIRFIEVAHESALADAADAGGVCGSGLIFGADAVGRAEVDFPHLRASPDYQSDFGRIKAVAWYGIVAYGLKWPTANDRECRVIRIGSL